MIYIVRVKLAFEGEALLYGGLYGERGNRFCTEVIWNALQKDLPPRMQQILALGVYYTLNPTALIKLTRFIDFESSSFITTIGKNGFFYNEFGKEYYPAFGRNYDVFAWGANSYIKLVQEITLASLLNLSHNSDLSIVKRSKT